MNPIIERWRAIVRRIEAVRPSNAPNKPAILLAVSKTQPTQAIIPLLEAGHRHFAENKVQEALSKWPALKERFPDVKLHLIGGLQTNKVKEALSLFDAIHTVDRENLIDALVKEKNERKQNCEFFIQVNTGEEQQKGGVAPNALPSLLHCAPSLHVAGLMCIPPAHESPAPHFALLRTLADKHNITSLSMGMSGDYETALAFGATHVRIGTALFGERI